jgi:hypothetical protein
MTGNSAFHRKTKQFVYLKSSVKKIKGKEVGEFLAWTHHGLVLTKSIHAGLTAVLLIFQLITITNTISISPTDSVTNEYVLLN